MGILSKEINRKFNLIHQHYKKYRSHLIYKCYPFKREKDGVLFDLFVEPVACTGMHQPANALCCGEKCIRPKHTFQLEPLQDGEYFNGLMDAQKATCKDQMNLFDVAATHLLMLTFRF